MITLNDVLAHAHRRATQLNVPYAGAVTPMEAFAILQGDPHACLIDVRSRAEWEWVGRFPSAIFIEWNHWPGGTRNPAFEQELRVRVPDKSAPVLFLCRSGGRSHHAALLAQQLGYAHAFNILEGFEGDKDANGHRGTVGGWKVAGLPWVQG
ncbi:MAG TPA: rhodanese-like domain-containing protein [Burkholderiales bacterium]|nr:rhodanese-like domain-containing protein [Burkholderiales bacterium]